MTTHERWLDARDEEDAIKMLEATVDGGVVTAVIPMDTPEEALSGLVAFVQRGSDEETVSVQWPIFPEGRFEPSSKVVLSLQAMKAFSDDVGEETLLLCDDAKRLRLGFVSYAKRGEKVAEVRQIPLRHVKGEEDDELRQWMATLRDRLLAREKETALVRRQRVATLAARFRISSGEPASPG